MYKSRKIDKDKPKNPFLTNNCIPVYLHKDKADLHTPISSDEIVEFPSVIGITKSFYRDSIKCTKLYHFQNHTEIINSLEPQACKLLLLLSMKLNSNQDLIKISTEEYSKYLNVSGPTVTNALQNLIDNRFICRYMKGYYWINPLYFFNGDRVKTYKENLRNVTDSEYSTYMEEREKTFINESTVEYKTKNIK